MRTCIIKIKFISTPHCASLYFDNDLECYLTQYTLSICLLLKFIFWSSHICHLVFFHLVMSCSCLCYSPCHFIFVLLLSFILFIFFVLLLLIIYSTAIFLSCSGWWYYNIYIFCYPQPPTLLPSLHVLCNATYIRGSMNFITTLALGSWPR